MNYRPVSPQDLEQVVMLLEHLMEQTVLPWQFDPETRQFYVEQNGGKAYITFNEGDAETELVRALTAHLPLLLKAIHNRFYFLQLEGIRGK